MDPKDLRQRIERVKAMFPKAHTALIQALHEVRWTYGYLHPEGIRLVSEVLGIGEGEIRDVASFYQYFKFTPLGKYHFRICTNITCMIHGAYDLMAHLKNRLGIEPGQVTEDGLFSYEEFECIGCGDRPPAILINDTRVEGVTTDTLDDLIERAKKGDLDLSTNS